MGIRFHKMVGAGNDFLVVDNRDGEVAEDLAEFARRTCPRHRSVGADGVLVVERSENADFRMRIFNADGSEAEMCGNGARCAARYALERGIAPREMSFETVAGPVSATVEDERVTIGMGEVQPVRPAATLEVDGRDWVVHPVEAGVPHAIIFTDDLEGAPVERVGRQMRNHPAFSPRGTNVDFVRVRGPATLQIRTYERGVEAETMACGTGAVASAVVGHGRRDMQPPIDVGVRGGRLTIDFTARDGRTTDVRLTGDAVFVYRGELCT